MSDLVNFARVLSDPTRWRIVRLVRDEALCVCELADILDMPQSSVSSHVQVIRRAGMLESEKCGKWTYFCIHEKFLDLIQTLENFFAWTDDITWSDDAAKVARRLAEREQSCCPGPERLLSRPSRAIPSHPSSSTLQ